MSKNYFRSQLRKLGKGRSPETVATPSASPVHTSMSRHDSTYSLSSIASGTSSANPTSAPRPEDTLERKEVISITGDVQKFVAAISELKKAIEADDDDISSQGSEEADNRQGDTEVNIMLLLKDLIQVVYSCLDQYQGMQSTEIKNAATELMSTFSTCDHETASRCPSCNSAVDVLVDAFTNSVQVFLGGEGHETLPQHRKFHKSTNLLKGFSKSHDNLTTRHSSYMDLTQPVNEPIVDKIDEALAHTENNVDVAARYIKMRTKYHREVTAYLAKRGHIEMRYHQDMLKLARKTHSAVTELQQQEECLPLVDLLLESVDQDMRFASNCNTTYNIQVGGRVVEPLEQKTLEIERVKKELMNTWQKELKKLSDAKTTMKSAKEKYQAVGQDLARVKTLLSIEPYGKQADKRKKEVADLKVKWKEAEVVYKNAVAVCNSCQYQVHKSAQQSILCAYRRLVLDFDSSLKSKLEMYFQLQHNFFFPIPDVMDSYLTTLHHFEIGEDFMQYIQRHPTMRREPEDFLLEDFNPEEDDIEETVSSQPSVVCRFRSSSLSDTIHHAPPLNDKLQETPTPQSWIASSSEPRARAPCHARKVEGERTRPNSMAYPNEDIPGQLSTRRNSEQWVHSTSDDTSHHPSQAEQDVLLSKNAITHTFKRLRAPSRCRECDNFVYFNGYECETCGLACHRKCLAPLSIVCGTKRLDRKLTTFGIDFLKHLEISNTNIPIIVTKCIKEIEERGLDTHGLYRISSTKTKMEHLCQLFERGVDRVDLSDRQPHLIASCLKLYFRQLPEPIFTFSLYEDMISLAREASHVLPCNLSTECNKKKESAIILLERLRDLLSCLDHQRYLTLARLFYHLHRVSTAPHVKKNSMPASNLGIVFGPTLLRRRDNVAALTLLADMTAQAKAIEILISHVNEVCTVSEEEILHMEGFDSEEGHIAEERLVDGIVEDVEPPMKYEADFDDSSTRTPYRTPFGTPPQRRRENICELGEVLETLQNTLPRRQSLPEYRNIIGEVRHHLQGSITTQDITSKHHSMQAAPLGKTLTPLEERVKKTRRFSGDQDASWQKVSSVGNMARDPNSSSIGMMGKYYSGVSHHSDTETTLSVGNPQRRILDSSSSTENLTEDQHTEVDSHSTSDVSGYYNTHALSDSGDLTADMSVRGRERLSPAIRVQSHDQYSSSIESRCETRASPTDCRDPSLTAPLHINHASAEGTYDLNLDVPDDTTSRQFKTLYSSPFPHSLYRKQNVSPSEQVCSPVDLELETDEVVTTFNYDSDDSDHDTHVAQAVRTAKYDSSLLTSLPATSQGGTVSLPHPFVSSVSPWHDKSRKKRINPLRVLKLAKTSPDLPASPDMSSSNCTRMRSPDDIAMEKIGDTLKRSRSCGLIDRTLNISPVSTESLHMMDEAIPSPEFVQTPQSPF